MSTKAEETKVSWRDDEKDMPHRREVIRQVTKLLEARKTDPSPKWRKELPFKARKLEEYLYKTASSLEEYCNEKTLKQRLKRAALSIARHVRIEKAYNAGLYTRPSPRNSLLRSESILSVQSRRSSGSLSEEWKLPSTNIPESTNTSSVSFWDVTNASPVVTRDSSFWDLTPGKEILQAAPVASLSELQELQRANRQLQDEILDNIRRQQETLRAMSNESDGMERQSSNSTPDVVPV